MTHHDVRAVFINTNTQEFGVFLLPHVWQDVETGISPTDQALERHAAEDSASRGGFGVPPDYSDPR